MDACCSTQANTISIYFNFIYRVKVMLSHINILNKTLSFACAFCISDFLRCIHLKVNQYLVKNVQLKS